MEEEKKIENNKASFGLKFLCFLIPLVGLIIFLSTKNEKPEYAKGCGIAALIGFIVGLVFIPVTILLVVVLGSLGIFVTNNVTDTINYANERSAQEIIAFNSKFESYIGLQSGTKVKQLISTIKSTNNIQFLDDLPLIGIELDGLTLDASSVLSQIKAGYSYNVNVHYDDSGLIDKVIINKK